MEPEFEINDTREPKDFSGTTFSEFKKGDVKKELLKSLRESSLEPACFWCAELICSGHYIEVWDTIILFYSRYIQQGSPSLCVYLEHRINTFREIARGFDPRFRPIFTFLMSVNIYLFAHCHYVLYNPKHPSDQNGQFSVHLLPLSFFC